MLSYEQAMTEYRKAFSTQAKNDFYKQREQEMIDLGHDYMLGLVDISRLQAELTSHIAWPYPKFSRSLALIAKGVEQAKQTRECTVRRLQPCQDETDLQVIASRVAEKKASKKARR